MTPRGPEDRSFRKSIDAYSVLGPWLVTADEIPDPDNVVSFPQFFLVRKIKKQWKLQERMCRLRALRPRQQNGMRSSLKRTSRNLEQRRLT